MTSFQRKLLYMLVAVGLFVAILVIRRPNGPLDQQRTRYKLSVATLGDVDPTSSTMLVVLGGMRGIASNILWSQAQDMQAKHDWTNLEVVVNSITKLEPHFISVWTFQGWNQAYNVAAEWDQVEDKYYWIKKGIRFLQRGTEANEHSPELRWDVGWTYFHKIGRADESEPLRKLFRADTVSEVDSQGRVQAAFNPTGLDNYMASLGWFQQAVDKCDVQNVKPKRMGEVAFRSYPAQSLINYAIYREKEGHFGEQIQADWLNALQALQRYADFDFQFTTGRAVHLDYPPEIYSDLYRATSLYTDSKNLNDAMSKDLDALSDEEKQALWTNWDELIAKARWTITEYNPPTIAFLPPGASGAFDAMAKSLDKMAAMDGKLVTQPGATGDAIRKVLADFAGAAEQFGRFADEELYWCDRYATMINYRYWKERAVCEHEMDTIDARQHFYVANQKLVAADLESAKMEFEQGLDLWQKIIAKFERVRNDDLTAEETADIVKSYLSVRRQLDLPDLADEDVPFRDYIERYTEKPPTAEEMEAMRQIMLESQKMQSSKSEEMQKAMMEKLKSIRAKATDPATAPAPESPDKKEP